MGAVEIPSQSRAYCFVLKASKRLYKVFASPKILPTPRISRHRTHVVLRKGREILMMMMMLKGKNKRPRKNYPPKGSSGHASLVIRYWRRQACWNYFLSQTMVLIVILSIVMSACN